MTGTKLSALTAATSAALADLFYLVQGGTSKKITKANLGGSATNPGFLELATPAEAQAGTDTARAVTPAGLAAYFQQPVTFGVSGATEGNVKIASKGSYDWEFYAWQSSFSGHPDNVLFFGYNAERNVASRSWNMAIEDYYWVDATHQWVEWYLEYNNVGNTVTRRPLTLAVNIYDNTVINQMYGKVMFYSSAGVQSWGMDDGGGLYSYGQQIVQLTNNTAFLRQYNVAYTALLNVAYVDGYNNLIIGDAGNLTVFIAGPKLRINGELQHEGAKSGFYNKAPVVQPTKAGHNNWAAISDVTAALAALGLVDAA